MSVDETEKIPLAIVNTKRILLFQERRDMNPDKHAH